jgi:polysaccharide biosynthesis/export protein
MQKLPSTQWTPKLTFACLLVLMLVMIFPGNPTLAQSFNVQELLNEYGSKGNGKSTNSNRAAGNNDRPDDDRDIDEEEPLAPRKLNFNERRIVRLYCGGSISEHSERLVELDERVSKLELDYCRRLGREIYQYGYDLFAYRKKSKISLAGTVLDSYILGIGDELEISYFGRETDTKHVIVDREGQLIFSDLPPVKVAGMTYGTFKRWLQETVKQQKIGTEVFSSLGSVKSLSVTVAGEVTEPGIHTLSSLSSVLDAIVSSKGIKKTGSLRRIQVIRGDKIIWIDLYDLFMSIGFSTELTLQDGDRVVVPLIGETYAVEGFVNRPAIYEFAEKDNSLSIINAVKQAGNALRPRGVFVNLNRFDASGREVTIEKTIGEDLVETGDILSVARSKNGQMETVELLGHVKVSGKRALRSAPDVKTLIRGKTNLRDNPYLLMAVLETTDPTTKARRFFPLNLKKILDNVENYTLRDGDRLIVLGANDIAFLNSFDVQNILVSGKEVTSQSDESSGIVELDLGKLAEKVVKPTVSAKTPVRPISSNSQLTRNIIQNLLDRKLITLSPENIGKLERELALDEKGSCMGLSYLASAVRIAGVRRYNNAMHLSPPGVGSKLNNARKCPAIYNEKPSLLPFVLENIVALNGEISAPGAYPIANDTSLSALISVAGGVTKRFSPDNLEVTRIVSSLNKREVLDLGAISADSVKLSPGDVVRFNSIYVDRDDLPVHLSGEFVRSGSYDIRRGERLSEVIARAGGLTPQAYPYGAVFTRESVKNAQKIAFRRTARELRSAALLATSSKSSSAISLASIQELTSQIESVEPLGRLVMETDPTVLQVRPEFDIVLQAGDKIFMPKRPSSVLVIGDVLNPGAMQFVAGTKVDEYVQQAGGVQQSADEDRMYLVYPNGVAQPVSVSVWNYNPVQVPPGSAIVIPKDPMPINLFEFTKEITSLISQMAITAASLAVIGNN